MWCRVCRCCYYRMQTGSIEIIDEARLAIAYTPRELGTDLCALTLSHYSSASTASLSIINHSPTHLPRTKDIPTRQHRPNVLSPPYASSTPISALYLDCASRRRPLTTAIMKPVVSAFNAWTWYAPPSPPTSEKERRREKKSCTDRKGFDSIVISIFAIIILSTIGGMFATNHHSMMGSTDDPEDGGKVAAAVFGAVVVYAVSSVSLYLALTHTTSSSSNPEEDQRRTGRAE